ncbi:hypothetical protein PPL_01224 [Heterostelium album PN500]|uniref:TsaA-like domain-containing protein n=1 Tax=Heterostelium pallidum (strain ATCC 26659 / Pp 5 / PN500) TaxID=670386 RepID=D3AYG4_HETP5|nr:hypothetical protein PPL_01224 [Heterostelium album PN500]EFA85991.1 hypothetical protein PPL_01224 [Heterostelium album PN500]|eukprot:XP_020438097.1 hypothetical protein PPL_01224 [Heterostelium album PN500]
MFKTKLNNLSKLLVYNNRYLSCRVTHLSFCSVSTTNTIVDSISSLSKSNNSNNDITSINDSNHKNINKDQILTFKRKKKKQFKVDVNTNLNYIREAEQLSLQNEKQDTISFDPIGYAESTFPNKNGAPRQGRLAPTSTAKIKILSRHADSLLKGLSDFSHVWILFWFHNNYKRIEQRQSQQQQPQDEQQQQLLQQQQQQSQSTNSTLSSKSKYYNKKDYVYLKENRYPPSQVMVSPPMLNGRRVGVLASRTPHRLVPIGMTMCKLDRVDYDTIYLSGIDMIDGTPIVDIKPYIPKFDSEPNATIPEWVNSKSDIKEIVFSDKAINGIIKTLSTVGLKSLGIEQSKIANNNSIDEQLNKVKDLIIEILLNEPRSIYRKKKLTYESWGFFVDTLNVECRVDENGVATVFDVEDADTFKLKKNRSLQDEEEEEEEED